VAPYHPSRKEYYTQKAIELKLPLPEFEKNSTAIGKMVSSEKVLQLLDYSFSKLVD